MRNKIIYLLLFFCFTTVKLWAQPENVNFLAPKTYTIAGIKVEGNQLVDANAIKLISELQVGEEVMVPGDAFSNAIDKIWKQKLFSDVEIIQEKVFGTNISLIIRVKELPRLSALFSRGDVSKNDHENIEELVNVYSGKMVTESLKSQIKKQVRNYYLDKRYLDVKVNLEERRDTLSNNTIKLVYNVTKGNKFKIGKINISGLSEYSVKEGKLRRAMKDTKERKWWRLWKASKFVQSSYETDKKAFIGRFNEIGLRDATILVDSVYKVDDKNVNIDISVYEGDTYYFGDIKWVGNTKYRSTFLDTVTGINKGDIYNQAELDARLMMSPDNSDVTSLYMDRGYLFFQLMPTEVYVDSNNYIHYEMRMVEGKQAYVKDVRVYGNTKTNDHVIYREIRTKPGDLFSRADIIRTQRELMNTGFFDQENFNIQPLPNPTDGTVDIEYTVQEKPSDQVELSGGWGGGRVVGTLGLSFNNFSLKNFFKKEAWQPLPSGDGQKLSIRAQSNGLWYQSYNFSFTEPWLGGKKPNSFTFSMYHTVLSNGVRKNDVNRQDMTITGGAIGLGRRNKFPDDFFQNYVELGYQRYNVNNYSNLFVLDSGKANAIYAKIQITRNSIDQPIYPTSGSKVTASVKFTPPYSYFDGVSDYSELSIQDRYKWIEYNKWKFTSSWFTSLSKKGKKHKLVLNTRIGFGFLNSYNPQLEPPFERFYLGGSGFTGFNNLDGREIIALRGYEDNAVSSPAGGLLISKYVAELRYPFSLNPSATIFGLVFAEGGNTWNSWKDFSPFEVKRDVGVGLRIFLPMFGLLGLDYGWGIDPLDSYQQGFGNQPWQGGFRFSIGMNLGEL